MEVAPGARIYIGAIVVAGVSGLAEPGYEGVGLKFVGIADSETLAGETQVLVRRNLDFLLPSVAGPGAITVASVGQPAWIVDDEYVASTDGGGTRSPAGIVTGVVSGGACWVRGSAAAVAGGSMRRIYAAANSDRDAAPIPDINGSIILPGAPTYMQVRTGWSLYVGSTRRAHGTSSAIYIDGNTHVQTLFGSINWYEFDNFGVLSATVTSVSVALLAQSYRLGELFTMEYAPSTGKLSLLAGGNPASIWRPVIHTLLIAGQ